MDAVVVRISCLGDVLSAEPFARMLAECGQYQKVFFKTDDYKEVFFNHPQIQLWTDYYSLHDREVFDLTGVYENDINTLVVDAYAHKFEKTVIDKLPRLYLTEEEKQYAESLLGNEKWVVVDIGYPCGPMGRGFWKFDKWAPVCNFLRDKGFKTVFVSNRSIVKVSEVDLNMQCKTNLRQMFAIIDRCELFVGMDSGPMHVAQALGTPGVAVFNPKHPAEFLISPNSCIKPVHIDGSSDLNCETIIAHLGELL